MNFWISIEGKRTEFDLLTLVVAKNFVEKVEQEEEVQAPGIRGDQMSISRRTFEFFVKEEENIAHEGVALLFQGIISFGEWYLLTFKFWVVKVLYLLSSLSFYFICYGDRI